MVSVLLLMAGKGTRMGYEKNKILLPFGDKYLFEYPLDTFLSFGFEVICVISKEDEEEVSKVLNKKNVKYTLGGKTRGESVYNGLKVANGDYIMIHDAARMFIDKDFLAYFGVAAAIKLSLFKVFSFLSSKALIVSFTLV